MKIDNELDAGLAHTLNLLGPTLANNTSNLVVLTDRAGRIVWVNAAFEARSGYLLAEVKGKTPGSVVGLEPPGSDTRERIRAALGRLEPIQVQLKNRARDGSVYWVDDNIHPVFDANGRHNGFVAIQTDITDLTESRLRLENVMVGAGCGTWEFNFKFRGIIVNDIFAAQIGYKAEELNPLSYETWRQMMHPDDAPMVSTHLRAVDIAKNDGFDMEYRLKSKAGEWRWVRAFGRIVTRDQNGEPHLMSGVQLDIHETKTQQEHLAAAREAAEQEAEARSFAETRMADIASVTSDWFWETDVEGRFTFMSEGVETTLGFPPDMFIGKRRQDVFEALDDTAMRPIFEAQKRREPLKKFVYEGRAKDYPDKSFWIQIDAVPIFSEDGAFAGYRGVGSDVTEVYRAREAAEAANRAKSDFLATVSHELRTPLNGVIGVAQLLEGKETDPEKRKLVAAIRESGDALTNILSDVLDTSKIESGDLTLEKITFCAADLGEKVRIVHAPKCADKGLRFDVLVGTGADVLRIGDPHRISQILHNLVNNAAKFTERGEILVKIKGAADAPLTIEVSDTGIGMTEEQAARIFDPYTQADETITRRFGGTGLGLAIVKQLVDLMNGEITVKSAPGRGTRFQVILPLPVARPESNTGKADAEELPSVAGLTVLAADDNAVNRELMRIMLEQEGVSVVIAHDGAEVVDLWRPGQFDAYLLDISMPRKDGVTALDEIRALEREAGADEAPAIAVTAHAMADQVVDLLAAGFDTVIAKPFRREDLLRGLHVMTT